MRLSSQASYQSWCLRLEIRAQNLTRLSRKRKLTDTCSWKALKFMKFRCGLIQMLTMAQGHLLFFSLILLAQSSPMGHFPSSDYCFMFSNPSTKKRCTLFLLFQETFLTSKLTALALIMSPFMDSRHWLPGNGVEVQVHPQMKFRGYRVTRGISYERGNHQEIPNGQNGKDRVLCFML